MNDQSKDELISAKLDNELTGDADRHAEKLLREQADARTRLQSFADVDKLLRQSLDAINNTPAPHINTYASIDDLKPETGSKKRTVSLPFAVAASVIMLLSGTLVGILTERITAPEPVVIAQPQPGSVIAASAPAVELSDALESNASGTTATLALADSSGGAMIEITRTWKLADGRYCREYEISNEPVAQREVGVACREHSGQWRIRMRTYPDATGTFL